MSNRSSNQRGDQRERSPPRRNSRTGDTEDRDDKQRPRASIDSKSSSKESRSSSKEKSQPKNDTDQSVHYAELTVELVKELKDTMTRRKKPKGTTDEQFIEALVAEIRKKEILQNVNDDEWEDDLRRYTRKCSDSLVDISRAYGDDLKRVGAILQAKIDNPPVASDTNEDDMPVETSFDEKGIAALKKLRRSENLKPSTLFHAVLEMDDTEIDRADRMFYSQARSLTGDNTYTYENAHDQVQAIRLMGQEIEDEDDLRCYIKDHRNFNDAYAYLRKLARDRIRRSETTTTTSKDSYSSAQNTGKKGNFSSDANSGNPSLTNSDTMGNNPPSQQSNEGQASFNHGGHGRPSLQQQNSTTRSGTVYNKYDNPDYYKYKN